MNALHKTTALLRQLAYCPRRVLAIGIAASAWAAFCFVLKPSIAVALGVGLVIGWIASRLAD